MTPGQDKILKEALSELKSARKKVREVRGHLIECKDVRVRKAYDQIDYACHNIEMRLQGR